MTQICFDLQKEDLDQLYARIYGVAPEELSFERTLTHADLDQLCPEVADELQELGVFEEGPQGQRVLRYEEYLSDFEQYQGSLRNLMNSPDDIPIAHKLLIGAKIDETENSLKIRFREEHRGILRTPEDIFLDFAGDLVPYYLGHDFQTFRRAERDFVAAMKDIESADPYYIFDQAAEEFYKQIAPEGDTARILSSRIQDTRFADYGDINPWATGQEIKLYRPNPTPEEKNEIREQTVANVAFLLAYVMPEKESLLLGDMLTGGALIYADYIEGSIFEQLFGMGKNPYAWASYRRMTHGSYSKLDRSLHFFADVLDLDTTGHELLHGVYFFDDSENSGCLGSSDVKALKKIAKKLSKLPSEQSGILFPRFDRGFYKVRSNKDDLTNETYSRLGSAFIIHPDFPEMIKAEFEAREIDSEETQEVYVLLCQFRELIQKEWGYRLDEYEWIRS